MLTRSSVALTLLVSMALVAGSVTIAQQTTELGSRSELDRLLKERHDVLQKRVTVVEQNFAQGVGAIDSVIEVRNQFLDAKLQLATTKKQRLDILRERVESMRAFENMEKQRHDAGDTPMESLLAVTAARLKSEIDLVREQP